MDVPDAISDPVGRGKVQGLQGCAPGLGSEGRAGLPIPLTSPPNPLSRRRLVLEGSIAAILLGNPLGDAVLLGIPLHEKEVLYLHKSPTWTNVHIRVLLDLRQPHPPETPARETCSAHLIPMQA